MKRTWHSEQLPGFGRISWAGWGLVVLRGTVLGSVTCGCLVLLSLLRLVERPVFGDARPLSPHVTRFVCRSAFLILGMKHVVQGQPMTEPGAMVCNHVSWLDIFALNAPAPVYFVAKSEVAGWPGIGWLARATGTVFIRRAATEAVLQRKVFEQRLAAGHRLLFFPEGTSTDGLRVLPFKSTLFEAFFAPALAGLLVQPVSLTYRAPPKTDQRFYGWWGDMDLGPHLLQVLAQWRQGTVTVTYHPPVPVAGSGGRKALAARCQSVIEAAVLGR